jgi:hypothetical protein
VSFAWVTAQETVRIAAVHGMMFGQPMRLFDIDIVESAVTFDNFYLPSNSSVSFVSASRIFELGKFIGHYPPLLLDFLTGAPVIIGTP